MHIMIDLETMGTRADAPIVSIGAVVFDRDSILQVFYRPVSLQSSVRSGAVIDPRTVMWWLRQSDVARAALEDGEDEAVSLEDALRDFAQLIGAYGDSLETVWGNGASFDNTIMHESAHRTNVTLWPFWKDRCYRTVKNSHRDVLMERVGEHHNALDDAKSQALHLMAINRQYPYYL
jgi:hypothetical protein